MADTLNEKRKFRVYKTCHSAQSIMLLFLLMKHKGLITLMSCSSQVLPKVTMYIIWITSIFRILFLFRLPMKRWTMSESAGVAITTILAILVIIDILGNALVCLIVKRNRDMRYVVTKITILLLVVVFIFLSLFVLFFP